MEACDFKSLVKEKFDARTTYDEGDERHPKLAAELVQRAQLQKGWKVLDLACGTGLVTYMASEVVGSDGFVEGVDISPTMIRQVQLALSVSIQHSLVLRSKYVHGCRLHRSWRQAAAQTCHFKLATLRSAASRSIPLMLYCALQPSSTLI